VERNFILSTHNFGNYTKEVEKQEVVSEIFYCEMLVMRNTT